MARKEEQVSKAATVTCAFCKGTGWDPFEIMSPRSKCQVCSGKGQVTVREKRPTIECAFCRGTGIFPGLRTTCYVCRGKGVVTKPKLGQVCPACDGKGMGKQPVGLPCITCKGKGQI